MIKLKYIANARIPTTKAHGFQIIKMSEALSSKVDDFKLIYANRKNKIKQDPLDYYCVKNKFKLQKLFCFDLVSWGKIGFWIESLTFLISVFFYSLKRNDLFYTRDESVAFVLLLMGKRVIWEAHMGHKNYFIRYILKHNLKIVVISDALKDLYIKLGAKSENIYILRDAVDLEMFDISFTKEQARAKLGLSLDKKIVLYTGSLYPWKGVPTLNLAKKFLENIEVLIISNEPIEKIPLYLKSADILVLPNSASKMISSHYTSPMKMFEYMASGNPILASRLPYTRGVLDEQNCYFFEPDNPENLADVVKEIFANYSEAVLKARRAYEKVKNYTWDKRAEDLISIFKK